MKAAPSLRARLLWRMLGLQCLLLTAFGVLVALSLHAANVAVDEDNAVEVLQNALQRDAHGRLSLRDTADLRELREEMPRLWYVIRDEAGRELRHGPVPAEFAGIGGALDRVSQARLGYLFGDDRIAGARLKRVDAGFGEVRILTTEKGRVMSASRLMWMALSLFATLILPLLAVMALVTAIATPMVVRWSLRSLEPVIAQARALDVERRGARLPEAGVPDEVRPLVSAVNGALARYDDGFERRRRFLADAAHELRTPIAILSARLESMPALPERERLLQDVARMSVLAEHLLDLQRLDRPEPQLEALDLGEIGQRVAADLAPLAIAAGYELAFEAWAKPVPVNGDALALERVLVNLVQNAIEYGGNRGTVTIRVAIEASDGVVEVCDEGPGIPPAHREHVFERFFRLQPHERGAGVGLNLVRDIVRLHRGAVEATDAQGGGACFRVALPLAAARGKGEG
ncbi:sensor histidine kinase [Lysobacter enzymogenes]|uniref:histidine kinase n=1 Tax=Lysobacter enzymogenes TaxID=69 RepID=A0A0S2DN01_LYSEN|nr:HAMP domain-containing sensor histidine kinase [Lysobacter enzymogenes]ALN59663.1 sensor histidine kinase [Lysobacter enzymogenes]QCW27777.1 HAMP domain-containing histidine kinase [Lysobacter enzymogenes]